MTFALRVATRSKVGNGLRELRAERLIPGVIYGPGLEPRTIQVGMSEFQKIYRSAGRSSLVDLTIDEGTSAKVLIQDVQVNPLTMHPQHIDLRQIRMDQELTVDIPLVFINEAPAVKGLSGTLVHAKDTISMRCLPKDLPHEIQIDLSSLKTFDDVITIADLTLPAGVTILDEMTDVLATVTAPLTEDQLKKMEEDSVGDVTAVKTEAEEKKAAEEAKVAEEAKAQDAAA